MFLTALNDSHTLQAARQAGCEMLLTKPIDFDGLLDALTVALYSAGCDASKAKTRPEPEPTDRLANL